LARFDRSVKLTLKNNLKNIFSSIVNISYWTDINKYKYCGIYYYYYISLPNITIVALVYIVYSLICSFLCDFSVYVLCTVSLRNKDIEKIYESFREFLWKLFFQIYKFACFNYLFNYIFLYRLMVNIFSIISFRYFIIFYHNK
jgi:hypothetical protein